MTTNTHWDAETYDRIGTPMRGWAQKVIEELELKGDETVLDAGCGSGSVTLDLLEKLPRGRIFAVDASSEMIASLTRALEERKIRNVIPLHASLTDFTLPEQVDAVFSNAVFHWIPDDDGLFSALFRATKPGGRMRAQCGGAGNNAHVLEAVATVRERDPFAAASRRVQRYEDVPDARARAGVARAGGVARRARIALRGADSVRARGRCRAVRAHDPPARPHRAVARRAG